MPVNRGRFIEAVVKCHAQDIADRGTDSRRWNLTIDGERLDRYPGDVHVDDVDIEFVLNYLRETKRWK